MYILHNLAKSATIYINLLPTLFVSSFLLRNNNNLPSKTTTKISSRTFAIIHTTNNNSIKMSSTNTNDDKMTSESLNNLTLNKNDDIPTFDGSNTAAKATDFANYFCAYAQLYHQKQMLTDHNRMAAYHAAIVGNSEVFKDKVVMDVGTGSGILAGEFFD